MPPKGWRKTAEGFQPTNSAGDNIKDRIVHGIDDLLLPRSVVSAIAKQTLPDGMPLPKDGVTALMRSATMFASYVTAEANQIARNDSRRTVTHTDILLALEKCDFAAFANPCVELAELRQQQKAAKPARPAKQGNVAGGEEEEGEGKRGADEEEEGEMVADEDEEDEIQEDEEPEQPPLGVFESKRAKTDSSNDAKKGVV